MYGSRTGRRNILWTDDNHPGEREGEAHKIDACRSIQSDPCVIQFPLIRQPKENTKRWILPETSLISPYLTLHLFSTIVTCYNGIVASNCTVALNSIKSWNELRRLYETGTSLIGCPSSSVLCHGQWIGIGYTTLSSLGFGSAQFNLQQVSAQLYC